MAPKIYPSLPGSTLHFVICGGVFGSQNLPLPPRIYPPFKFFFMCDPPRIYPSFPEYTPFLTTTCDPPTIYPSFSEYTPFLVTICNPLNIYPSLPEYPRAPFQQLQYYATLSEYRPTPLPEYTPPFDNYMRPSHDLPLLPRLYTLIFNKYM